MNVESQLSQHILGLEPYVLVKLEEVDEVDGGLMLKMSMEIGGGFSTEDGLELLKLAVEELESKLV